MKDYFIYNHGGSGNHGCEALVRTTISLFQGKEKTRLFSEAPQEDTYYRLDKIAAICSAKTPWSRWNLHFARAYYELKVHKDYIKMDSLPYRKPIGAMDKNAVELSIGGDVYCYEDYKKVVLLHKMVSGRGCKSVLLGCSLEEHLFEDPVFVEDMRRYDYISARESLTYEMLQRAGLMNIGLTPDAAFTLETEELPLPEGFLAGNTIGINLSPLVVRKEPKPGIVLENFIRLIRYILDSTDCNVALIPHVVWQNNDDRTVLKQLHEAVHCPERVVLIEDHNCMQLKGFIARCRMFVGARTHATIAAYSSCVPTLVVGYSVKSRGIARDLLGTEDGYVLPVQQMTEPDQLTKAFSKIWECQDEIRQHLENIMPGYIERASSIKKMVERALEDE